MSIIGFLKEWGGAATLLNSSDRMIANLVGENPKGYHPKVYRGVIDAAKDFEQEELNKGRQNLNVYEFSALRIALMASIAENAEDFIKAQNYVDALGKIRRTCNEEIRLYIRWNLDDIIRPLSVVDSNPSGTNRSNY
jgi:hypothetical protein